MNRVYPRGKTAPARGQITRPELLGWHLLRLAPLSGVSGRHPQVEIASGRSERVVERPETAPAHDRGGQEVDIDPAEPTSPEPAAGHQLQHVRVRYERSTGEAPQVGDHRLSPRTEPAEHQLAEDPRVEKNLVGLEEFSEGDRPDAAAEELDPDRSVDKPHRARFREPTARLRGAVAPGISPRSPARRRRAAWSTSAFRPRRTAAVFVGAPVTRMASSRSPSSISSVVLMHKESHKEYASSSPEFYRLRAAGRRSPRATRAPSYSAGTSFGS